MTGDMVSHMMGQQSGVDVIAAADRKADIKRNGSAFVKTGDIRP
jgi:hypothetical protein